ncbi:hypothetical protein [Salinibius halmophilus]|uniref:hypothetical protein n=1 Tax=Salinibius halmophilus TaxID=1853216 RepID=UPI000E6723A4|nr:hypothetical protein [Salinibius halmophilus]
MVDPAHWQIIVSGFCALLLATLLIALICNPSFRKDLAASEGKANLFKVVSVEGALVLSLSALLFYGMIYPVHHPQLSFAKQAQMASVEVSSASQAFAKLLEHADTITAQQALISDQAKRIESLEYQATHFIAKPDIADFIAKLSPDDPLSQALYTLPSKGLGPWSPYQQSQLISVSVPARRMVAGRAATCQSLFQGTYELFGALQLNGSQLVGEPVTVTASELIYRAADCSERVSYQMQIACEDAMKLFTKQVLRCSTEGEALWQTERPQTLQVSMVRI